jgi:hypothetical protein
MATHACQPTSDLNPEQLMQMGMGFTVTLSIKRGLGKRVSSAWRQPRSGRILHC